MNWIFIEAKSKYTTEYQFISAIIKKFFPDKEVDFIAMDGIGNLFKEANVNQIKQAITEGAQVLVLVDADTVAKGAGYEKRKQYLDSGSEKHKISFPYFIYPDNRSEGEVETLMEAAARRDLHGIIFDCFEDYERCVSGRKGDDGQPFYNTPNLKVKLHTYITAQKVSRKLRDNFGNGDWLFDREEYWDLTTDKLIPLRNFFKENLK